MTKVAHEPPDTRPRPRLRGFTATRPLRLSARYFAIRKRRIDSGFRRAALADLALLDITTDQQTDSHARTDTLNLADQFRLSVYDAAYLELARRRELPLATLDQELRAAATATGVTLLGSDPM